MRQVVVFIIEEGWIGSNAWFSSVLSCLELKTFNFEFLVKKPIYFIT